MKQYTLTFPAPLTPEQEQKLYAGFSAFYYDVSDKLDEGIKVSENQLYRHASNLAKRVTGVDGSQLALDRIKLMKNNLESHLGWDRIEPGKYEFHLNVAFFNQVVPTMGDKLDYAFLHKMFEKQILPKLGLKKNDVKIETLVVT